MDAILSAVIREPHISVRQALRDYIRFYSRIIPYRDHYVVGLFEEVTSDFGKVIKRVNQRFETSFSPFVHSEENVREVFKLAEQADFKVASLFEPVTSEFSDWGRRELSESRVARPSRKRESMKPLLKKELESEHARDLIVKAEAVYDQFTLRSTEGSLL